MYVALSCQPNNLFSFFTNKGPGPLSFAIIEVVGKEVVATILGYIEMIVIGF
jgi:hypothetical protein